MNDSDSLIRYAVRDFVAKNSFAQYDGSEYFETDEDSDCKSGFNSDVFFGRIVYTDKFGEQQRSESMVIKLMPEPNSRSKFLDVMFSNEIFFYTKVIPFFASFNDSISSMFPKFYYGALILGNSVNENATLVVENLSAAGYETFNRTFWDLEHLLLSVKSLARFHAHSYYAKNTQPRAFYSLAKNLVETHFTATKEFLGALNLFNDYYTEMLSNDRRYSAKTKYIRQLLQDVDKFMEKVFTEADEPVAVICHGDFLKNNLMFKYDSNGHPIRIKLFDMASARYCSPVVDLALILYMNADQEMRNRHWDELLDAYYTTLRDTFPDIEVPSKDQIIAEFEVKSLYAYVLASFFIPFMLTCEETGPPNWQEVLSSEYEEFAGTSYWDLPKQIMFSLHIKLSNPSRGGKVLDVLKDIIDRGFV